MQGDFIYFVLALVVTAVALLTLLRIYRAAKGTIEQLNDESRRDRLQHERIAREKQLQTRALRRGTRKITGQTGTVGWDQSDRRAKRDLPNGHGAREVFDPATGLRGTAVRTPWGWPGAKGRDRKARRKNSSAPSRFGAAVSGFFRPREIVDNEVRARRAQSIRALVEDRYGRVGYAPNVSEIEWLAPQLPRELLKERETDQMLAWRMGEDVENAPENIKGLCVVAGKPAPVSVHLKASGE